MTAKAAMPVSQPSCFDDRYHWRQFGTWHLSAAEQTADAFPGNALARKRGGFLNASDKGVLSQAYVAARERSLASR
jgi:hypothetical protein